jgi:hypothetical protein
MPLRRSPFLWDILRLAILVVIIGYIAASISVGYQEAAAIFVDQFLSFCRDLETIVAPILAALTGLFLFLLILYGTMDITYRSGLPPDAPRPTKSHYPHLVAITIITSLASLAKMIQESTSPNKLSIETLLAALEMFKSYALQGFRADLWIWIWVILFWLLALRLAHTTLLVVIIVIRGCFRSCGLYSRRRSTNEGREADEEQGGAGSKNVEGNVRRSGSREHSPLPVIVEELEPPPTPSPYLHKLAL